MHHSAPSEESCQDPLKIFELLLMEWRHLCRRGLSLELSLGIVFFTNIVLSLAALIYIVTGINTDLFLWAKDYIVSLKDEDSAVNAKVSPVSLRTI